MPQLQQHSPASNEQHSSRAPWSVPHFTAMGWGQFAASRLSPTSMPYMIFMELSLSCLLLSFSAVGGSHVASVTGTVRYTITLTNGAKNIPTNSQLTLTTSGVTPAATNCKAAIGGVNTTIPTAQAISNATMLASTLVITCDLDVTVTAAHKIAGTIASFTVSAAYSGASLTGTDIQAMYIPAVTTPAVPVYTGNILAVTAQQVVTTDPSKYINGEQCQDSTTNSLR